LFNRSSGGIECIDDAITLLAYFDIAATSNLDDRNA
jgi:hypothetical protein